MSETVVILGVGEGFGLSIARAFGQVGKHPILVARNEEKLRKMAAALHDENIAATPISADATNPQQTERMFKQVVEKFGVPETFIYNVGNTSPDDPFTTPIEQIKRTFDMNVLGAITTIRQFINLTTDFEKKRNVLITGGGAALHPNEYTATLSLTKAALRSFVFSLQKAVKGKNIYIGLITIQGISDLNEAMQPQNVAKVYLKAVDKQQDKEIFYPGETENEKSEIEQLEDIAKDKQRVSRLLQKHPEILAFIKQHPELKNKIDAC
ncbi:SDR family NAD(P)-dependent oxidoreductase [Lactiplantibacillus plantarum]|nr:SDR family NAD(P)-dependent oxidoreductase [Lactiplantibacillus plantarum]